MAGKVIIARHIHLWKTILLMPYGLNGYAKALMITGICRHLDNLIRKVEALNDPSFSAQLKEAKSVDG